jgi:hypothetical protein
MFEHYYGLKRSVLSSGRRTPLTSSDRAKAWAILVLVPYLTTKAELLYERCREPSQIAWKTKLKRIFVSLFKSITFTIRLLNVVFYVAFLYRGTAYYDIYMRLIGQIYERRSPDQARIEIRDKSLVNN